MTFQQGGILLEETTPQAEHKSLQVTHWLGIVRESAVVAWEGFLQLLSVVARATRVVE